tara:strand:- start:1593 stop:2531 length:939 start_codon:yes stop_codon:yes gene_type:complete
MTSTYQYDTHEEAEQEIIRLSEVIHSVLLPTFGSTPIASYPTPSSPKIENCLTDIQPQAENNNMSTTTTYQYDTHEEAEQEIIRLTTLVNWYRSTDELHVQQHSEELLKDKAAAEEDWCDACGHGFHLDNSASKGCDVCREDDENWPPAAEEEEECKCDKCEKMISYDDCVHYEEFVYLCKECGIDENGILYEDICIECYDRKCGGCPYSDDEDSSSDYNPDEDEEKCDCSDDLSSRPCKKCQPELCVALAGRDPEGAAAAKKRIKQIDEVIGLRRDRAPPVPTTAFGDGTCGSVDFTRPSMFVDGINSVDM